MAKSKKTEAPRRVWQTKIAATETDRHPDVEEAALAYVEGRDERMEATKKEVELSQRLLDAMREHDLTEYRIDSEDPPLVVRVIAKDEKVQVRQEKPRKDGADVVEDGP